MGQQKKWRPEREPDVETKGFRLWKVEKDKGKDYGTPLLTVNYDEGEELHESRDYTSLFPPGYSLLILAKRKGEQYWFAVKGKRPNGSTFITTEVQGPLSLEEYHKQLVKLELGFSPLFNTTNPLVTPGKHYNLYVRGYAGRGGDS